MLHKIVRPKFLLAIAVTAALFGAVACSAEEAATPLPAAAAAPAQAAAAGAAAAAVAAPGAPKAPAAAAAAGAAMAPAAMPKVPAAAKAATAVKAAAVTIAEAKRGERIEVRPRVAPAAALAATAEGEQHMTVTLSGLSNWKPWREGGGNRPWFQWIYMPPFMFDNNNNLVQGFADAYTFSDDGLTFTLHLDPNGVFQDGSPITADSYKWALEFGVRPEDQVGWGGSTVELGVIEGLDAAAAGEREDITGIVVVDDHTLDFKLKKPTAFFPYSLSTWLQAIFKAEDAEAQGDDFFLNPIGVGPYKISVDPVNSIVSMTATENWWEPAPIIQTLTINFVPEAATRLVMFENGDTDFIYGSPSQQPGVHDPSHPMNSYLSAIPYGGLAGFVRLNTAIAPFEDINIRKALAHSVDFDAVVAAVYGDKSLRGVSVLVPEMACWDSDYKGYSYDPEMAKAYLAQSTYKTGAAVPSIEVQSRPASTQWNLTLQAWQAAWKDVLGIDFKIHLIERGQEVPPGINMIRDSAGAHVPDPGFLMQFIIPSTAPGALWSNLELDAKLTAANSMSPTDPNRCLLLQEVDQDFMDNYFILPLTKVNAWFLVQPWVLGFETSAGNDLGSLPFMKIGQRTR